MYNQIDYTPCAGDGDYSVWVSNYTKQPTVAHCPSESESLYEGHLDEHPSDEHLIDWDNIGCADEIAEEYDPSKDECDEL